MRRFLIVATAAAALAAAGCSGGTRTASLPPVTGTGGPSHRTTHARLIIHVPPRRHAKKIRVRGHYVSPATASLTYAVTPALAGGATSGEVDINTSNPDCTVTGVVGYLACTIDIAGIVPSTPYTFSFTTWDAAGGTGNVLSANDNVPFTATPGANNTLSATLGGVASALIVTPITPYSIEGSSAALTVYGNHTVKFTVTPIDAQDNFIIGPGAPQPTASLAPGANATFAAVGAASPNEWTLTSTYEPADPGIPSTTSLNVTATPVPGSGGSTLSVAVPVKLYQPWIYVTDFLSGTVSAYDEDGNEKIAPGTAFAGLTQPPGIAYDTDNGWLYVSDNSPQQVSAYDRLGNLKVAAFPVTGSASIGLAYDSHNHWLYVAGNGNGLINAYDAQGNLQSTPGGFTFTGLTGPRQMSFDPQNDQLYATFDNIGTILVFDETGTPVTTSGGFPNVPNSTYSNCAGYDPINAWIWACDFSHIAAYDGDGNSVVAPFHVTGNGALLSVAVDPYNGLLYFGNNGSGGLAAMDRHGNPYPLAAATASLSLPSNLVVVK